jgi:hypothetical protein
MNGDFSQIGPICIALLVVFLVYRRFRRNFGKQPLRPVRMRVRIVILLIVAGLLLPVALRSAAFVSALFLGLGSGIALAIWGASRTGFVKDSNQQLYYVPHLYTGVAVSLLFLGRLVYRLLQAYGNVHAQAAGLGSPDQAVTPASMVRSPLTVGLFFVLMGYYVCYYSIVLWKSQRINAEQASRSVPTSGV